VSNLSSLVHLVPTWPTWRYILAYFSIFWHMARLALEVVFFHVFPCFALARPGAPGVDFCWLSITFPHRRPGARV